MGDPLELRALPKPRTVAELTPEAQIFKSFKTRWKQKEASRIVSLAFCPEHPHRLAVVSGTKVTLWHGGKDGEPESSGTLSKFKDLTQCVGWRSDGKLLLAGEAGGSCAVIEAETKKVLRRFRGHGDAVTCATFADMDKTRAATGGRDGRLRIWDVATCELLQTVDAHTDCMKALSPGPGGPDAWISAAQDGHVKLWDLRAAQGSGAGAGACAANADHGHPVEAGAAFPGGAMYASAGGPAVKVWDLAAGGRLVQALEDAHSKTVTAVCLDSMASVMLTASFDGLAKVYHAAGLQHLWTYRLDAPATCAAWRPDNGAFAVGLDDGGWQLRQKRVAAADGVAASGGMQRPPVVVHAKSKGRQRGLSAKPASDDEVVTSTKRPKKREAQIEYFFRKFEYRKAVEFMVLSSTAPSLGFAIVDEFVQRGELSKALRELGEDLCLAVLMWLMKAFGGLDAQQQRLFHEALHTLVNCNECLQPPITPALIDALSRLENKVSAEMRIQEMVMETNGMLKALVGF